MSLGNEKRPRLIGGSTLTKFSEPNEARNNNDVSCCAFTVKSSIFLRQKFFQKIF